MGLFEVMSDPEEELHEALQYGKKHDYKIPADESGLLQRFIPNEVLLNSLKARKDYQIALVCYNLHPDHRKKAEMVITGTIPILTLLEDLLAKLNISEKAGLALLDGCFF